MNGRKRHILVDTQGLLLKVKVHEAGLSDKVGAKMVLEGLSGRFPRMRKVWADYAYRGLKEWTRTKLGRELEVVRHNVTVIEAVVRIEDLHPQARQVNSGANTLLGIQWHTRVSVSQVSSVRKGSSSSRAIRAGWLF